MKVTGTTSTSEQPMGGAEAGYWTSAFPKERLAGASWETAFVLRAAAAFPHSTKLHLDHTGHRAESWCQQTCSDEAALGDQRCTGGFQHRPGKDEGGAEPAAGCGCAG